MEDKLALRPLSELRSDYWMIKKLGHGGFGKVYLIRHRKTRENSAAKHHKWKSPKTKDIARREAVILKKLEHPKYIVR